MSVNKSYYVIAGYDLTGWETDKYEDWKWTDEGEAYLCNQRKGKIQLFDDPMSNSHLYLGAILVAGDEYEFRTTKFDMEDAYNAQPDVMSDLVKLIDFGVISRDPKFKPKFQIIAFEECS